jgi:hypothetical protein
MQGRMNRIIFSLLVLMCGSGAWAQATFKAGWGTYQTGTLTREYTYYLTNNDTAKLNLVDSLVIFTAPDSLVTLTVHIPFREKCAYKTVNYFNPKKQILKTEEYKNDELLASNQWEYDEKNRRKVHYEDNKASGNNFRKTYEYATDKKNGDFIVSENSYLNGRIEFYTRTYYDKNNVKYKEIRLNDNNKDVVHIENFYYGENGKLIERSVYFPEWKVTKKFSEREGTQLPKCFKCMPVGTAEKISLQYRVPFIKHLLGRYQQLLYDKECDQFEYIFKNFTNCEIIISSCNLANTKKVTFRYKEKPH